MDDPRRQYVLRARFQPFCRDHYEAILGFFLEFAQGKREQPHLYLWVVRHFQTVANSAGVDWPAGDESALFRHSTYFNPLRLDECITGIRQGIRDYVTADLAKGLSQATRKALEEFRDWSAIYLQTCPVRISVQEMGYFWGDAPYTAVPLEVEKVPDFGFVAGFHLELLPEIFKTSLKVVNNVRTRTAKSLVAERARLLAAFLNDLADPRQVTWYLPVYDHQDVGDSLIMQECGWKYEARTFLMQNSSDKVFNTKLEPISGYTFCALNAFAYFAFIMAVKQQQRKIVPETSVNEELTRLELFLVQRSSKDTADQFKTESITHLQHLQTNLPERRKSFLTRADRFPGIVAPLNVDWREIKGRPSIKPFCPLPDSPETIRRDIGKKLQRFEERFEKDKAERIGGYQLYDYFVMARKLSERLSHMNYEELLNVKPIVEDALLAPTFGDLKLKGAELIAFYTFAENL